MSKKILILLLVLLLAACSEEEEKETKKSTPTPTPVTAGYTGPFIGNSMQEGDCLAGGGCSGVASEVVEAAEESLPLVTQEVGDFRLGIPEGYSPLVVADEIVITAESSETIGGFTVVMRKVDAAALEDIRERFEGVDFSTGTPIENETLPGHKLPNSNLGTIALLEAETGEMIFVEGFASPGYWPAFSVTFDAMLETIMLTP